MFVKTTKASKVTVSKVTWKTILLNPLIFGTMAIPSEGDSILLLICNWCCTVAFSGLMVLGIPSVCRRSVFFGCYVSCLF